MSPQVPLRMMIMGEIPVPAECHSAPFGLTGEPLNGNACTIGP
jgi:hypothetical protein